MKRHSIIRKIFSVVFAVIVLYTVSVREAHYLFVQHHFISEHCSNHLHSEKDHSDCVLCYFDVSLFTEVINHPSLLDGDVFPAHSSSDYQSVILLTEISPNSLRGPPSFV